MRSLLAAFSCFLLLMGQVRVNVELVLVPATVNDSEGHFITGMDARHFRLWEDNVEQSIEQVATEDVPMSIGLVMDSSDSMKDKVDMARKTALAFLESSTRDDEFFLIEVHYRPHLIVDFTNDVSRLQQQLLVDKVSGATALLDAVSMGVNLMRQATRPRKLLLVISDGGDNHSVVRCSRLRDRMLESGTQLDWIGLSVRTRTTPLPEVPKDYKPPCGIASIALTSGGTSQSTFTADGAVALATRIAQEVRAQYVIAYRPSNPNHDGKYRRLKVALNLPGTAPQLFVRAKQGYFAPK